MGIILRDSWQILLLNWMLNAPPPVTSIFQRKITAFLSILLGAVAIAPVQNHQEEKMWLFTAEPETRKERMDDACPAAQLHRKLGRPGAKNAVSVFHQKHEE